MRRVDEKISSPLRTAIITLFVGVAVGAVASHSLWGTRSASTISVSSSDRRADGSEQLYTCGMHPNVMQKGPGICPICNMKLTPLKADQGSATGEASKERKILYWRAPMDPNYISDKPGRSPMGMGLVPVYADEESSSSSHIIRIDPVTIQNMGIRTVALKRGPLIKTIRTLGRVDYDERLVTFMNTKFDGWVQKLHADETGQFVEKGQPLFDVYSRELYSAQEEYLAALRGFERMGGNALPSAREEKRSPLA